MFEKNRRVLHEEMSYCENCENYCEKVFAPALLQLRKYFSIRSAVKCGVTAGNANTLVSAVNWQRGASPMKVFRFFA
jgi:hypothetical protein